MAFWNRKKKQQQAAAPRFETLRSGTMLLRVAAPCGEDWQRMEATARGGMLAGFKCIHGTPPDALALDAMLYSIAPGMPASLEELKARDWRDHFKQKMFATLNEVEQQEVKHYAASGFPATALQLTVTGSLRAPPQPLQVVERYVPFDKQKQLLAMSRLGLALVHNIH